MTWILAALIGAVALDTVRAALRGDRRASTTLLTDLTPVIRARARRAAQHTPNHLNVEDLTQEVWLRLVADDGRLLHGYDPSLGYALRSYVAKLSGRIAKDVLRDAAAKKRGGGQTHAQLPPDDTLPGESSEAHVEHRDTLRALLAYLDTVLPERGRLVLRYLYADGASPQVTADALGIAPNVVYNWQYKIRQKANAWMAEQSPA